MSFDVLRNLKVSNYRKKNKTNKKETERENNVMNVMKVEYEEITCHIDENFVPFKTDGKCMICEEKTATNISENYLDIYIEYNNGGGCDAVSLAMCDSCIHKHTEKVLSARKNKESVIVYCINH